MAPPPPENQIDYFDNRFLGTNLANPNFADIARAMGAEGIVVSHVDEVGDALRTAVASGKPTVLDVRLTRELGDPFRRAAFQYPVRLLKKYEDLTGSKTPASAAQPESAIVSHA